MKGKITLSQEEVEECVQMWHLGRKTDYLKADKEKVKYLCVNEEGFNFSIEEK